MASFENRPLPVSSPSSSTSSSIPTTNLSVDDLLVQIARSMKGRSGLPIVPCPMIVTQYQATIKAAEALHHHYPTEEIVLVRELPARRTALRKLAQSMQIHNPEDSQNLGACSNVLAKQAEQGQGQVLPDPDPASVERRAALRQMARDMDWSCDTHLRLPVRLTDRSLPLIAGSLRLRGIDGDDGSPTQSLPNISMLFDTGAAVSVISGDLLQDRFRDYLYDDDENAPYRIDQTSKVQVDATLAFSNCSLQVNCIMLAVPRSSMPNQHSSVLLGQKTVIDSLQYDAWPRKILEAKGQPLPASLWGRIDIKAYARPEGGLTELKEVYEVSAGSRVSSA